MFDRLKENEFICIWAIWNGLFAAFLGAATILGYTSEIFTADKSFISYLIAVVFLIGWGYSLHRAIWINGLAKNPTPLRERYAKWLLWEKSAGDARETLGSRLAMSVSTIDYVPIVLVSLGLVGTVLGFMIGMSEVKPEMIGNLESAGATLTTMLRGLAIGFITTLVGVSGAIWIQFQKHLLSIEIAKVYERVLSGE